MANPPESVEALIRGVTQVHSLPLFYSRLDETINHPRSSIANIAKLISEDPGLTGRILKLANSPLFACLAKIESITQAITIIGVQQVRDLALAISVMDVFKGIPAGLIDMQQFWRHSIATGIAARVLATNQREANLERFFVMGILHDIGRLTMIVRLPDLFRTMLMECRETGRSLHQIERERLGFDHSEVSGELLKKWKIPSRIAEPVELHHRPMRANQYPREASVLHLADVIVHAMELGKSGDAAIPALDTSAWNQLGLPPYVIRDVVQRIDATFDETVKSLFGASNAN
jgi:HD-like signal output (HDOD) protein